MAAAALFPRSLLVLLRGALSRSVLTDADRTAVLVLRRGGQREPLRLVVGWLLVGAALVAAAERVPVAAAVVAGLCGLLAIAGVLRRPSKAVAARRQWAQQRARRWAVPGRLWTVVALAGEEGAGAGAAVRGEAGEEGAGAAARGDAAERPPAGEERDAAEPLPSAEERAAWLLQAATHRAAASRRRRPTTIVGEAYEGSLLVRASGAAGFEELDGPGAVIQPFGVHSTLVTSAPLPAEAEAGVAHGDASVTPLRRLRTGRPVRLGRAGGFPGAWTPAPVGVPADAPDRLRLTASWDQPVRASSAGTAERNGARGSAERHGAGGSAERHPTGASPDERSSAGPPAAPGAGAAGPAAAGAGAAGPAAAGAGGDDSDRGRTRRGRKKRRRQRDPGERRITAAADLLGVGQVVLLAWQLHLWALLVAVPLALLAVGWSRLEARRVPAQVTAWQWGTEGEGKTEALLAPLEELGCVILHDRTAVETGTLIDHLVVAPSGVWVIETKSFLEAVQLRGANLLAGVWSLHDDLVAARAQGVEVRTVLEEPASACIHPVMALHGRTKRLGRKGREVSGVHVIAAHFLPELIATEPERLPADLIEPTARILDDHFPVANERRQKAS